MSAPPWAHKSKVCVRCKRDCSGLARVKNPQGQYMCRECYDAEALGLKAAPATSGDEVRRGAGEGDLAPGAGATPGVPTDDTSIPLEEIVNAGEGLGAHSPRTDGTPRDIPMCSYCGMPLKDETIICTGCGMNSTTGLFLNGKPATAAHVCVKCGYDMRGLKSPRCPECGTVNTRAMRLKHMPREQEIRENYIRPAVYAAIGLAISVPLVGLRLGWSAVPVHLLLLGAAVVAAIIAFAICAVIWLGFEAPLPVIGARLAGIVCLTDAAEALGSMVPFSGLGYILPVVAYAGLLSDLFDLDLSDSAILTLITAGVYIVMWLLVLRYL